MQATDVLETAKNAMNQPKSFLTKQLEERTHQVGHQIESVANDLHSVSRQLRQSQTVAPAAEYVDQGAQTIERVGRYLEDADSERLIADLESIARRQPWVMALGALMVGFSTSRLMKVSSARRNRDGDTSYGDAAYGGTNGGIPYGDDTTQGARRRMGMAAQNPLGLALGALGVGVLAGLVMPVTEVEREKIGPLRDQLVERAQAVPREIAEHGREVLEETTQAAMQAAQQAAQRAATQVVGDVTGATQHGQGQPSQGQQGQSPGGI
jgi:hypothetical protein